MKKIQVKRTAFGGINEHMDKDESKSGTAI